MTWRSVHVRLTACYMSALVAGMLLLGAGLWIFLRHELLVGLDQMLADRAKAMVMFLQTQSHNDSIEAILDEAREYATSLPAGNTLQLYGPGHALLFSYPPEVAHLEPRLHLYRQSAQIHGHQLRIVLGTPLQQTRETLTLLRGILLSLTPVVLVIAGLGGWWLSRRALHPVEQMTVDAERVGIHNTAARLVIPQTGDELQHLGEAWNRMLGRIHESVQRTLRFTTDAAHDLRTPVAVIQSTADIALRRERGALEYKQALLAIADEARQLTRLLEQLVWLARGDSGAGEFEFDELALENLLVETCATVLPLAESQHIELKCVVQKAARSMIRGDRAALRRLVLILTDNAIKFSPPGAAVSVRAYSEEGACRIEVEDQGAGIASSDLAHIFDRFYRADRARARDGFGLGLAIAKAIVEAHQGTIAVKNTSPSGTVFEVRLPVSRRLVACST